MMTDLSSAAVLDARMERIKSFSFWLDGMVKDVGNTIYLLKRGHIINSKSCQYQFGETVLSNLSSSFQGNSFKVILQFKYKFIKELLEYFMLCNIRQNISVTKMSFYNESEVIYDICKQFISTYLRI